jgi:circadian clock protein KaiC
VIDPVTSFVSAGVPRDVQAMLARMIDHLKTATITAMFTGLAHAGEMAETDSIVSSLIDTWIVLSLDTVNRQHQRTIAIPKSRGMAHSDRTYSFWLTDSGIGLAQTASAPEPAVASAS